MEANLKEITGSIVYMGIHGSDCHKPVPQSDLHKFSLCLREVGERNIIKVAGDRKSRIFIWNVAEPLQR